MNARCTPSSTRGGYAPGELRRSNQLIPTAVTMGQSCKWDRSNATITWGKHMPGKGVIQLLYLEIHKQICCRRRRT